MELLQVHFSCSINISHSVTPMDVLLCFHSPCALCDLFPHVWLCHYVQVCLVIILIYVPHISCIQFCVSWSGLINVYVCVRVLAAFLWWITLMWIIKDCLSLFFFFVRSLLHRDTFKDWYYSKIIPSSSIVTLKHTSGLILRNVHCAQLVLLIKFNYNFYSLERYVS